MSFVGYVSFICFYLTPPPHKERNSSVGDGGFFGPHYVLSYNYQITLKAKNHCEFIEWFLR